MEEILLKIPHSRKKKILKKKDFLLNIPSLAKFSTSIILAFAHISDKGTGVSIDLQINLY